MTIVIAKITGYDGDFLTLVAPFHAQDELIFKEVTECEVHLLDGRKLSAKQRNAILLTVHDIAEYLVGFTYKKHVTAETMNLMQYLFLENYTQFIDDREYKENIRFLLTQRYCQITDTPLFSLSHSNEECIDMTTAREFLTWLIDFCLEHNIPCSDRLINRAEDIGRYLYGAMVNKRCIICGEKPDLHHVDHVGPRGKRKEIVHKGLRAMSLCREHHEECHIIGQETFNDKYHVFGIILDDKLCSVYRLRKKKDEIDGK